MKYAQKIGRFYMKIMMKNIGIFIFMGVFFVLFQKDGWFPNRQLYAIAQIAYSFVLPCIVAYAGGSVFEKRSGGIMAVMALCGLMTADINVGLFGAMLSGPIAGYVSRKENEFLDKTCEGIEMQMLIRNFCLGITGCLLAAGEYYLLAAAVHNVMGWIYRGVDFLIVHNGIALLNIIIEPAKVFFMNNLINHGILIPLGLNQVREAGQSCLFLLEANPGPGLGMLAALCWVRRAKREEYVSAALAESIGGIHEVYFPVVLTNLKLLIPLILGGMAGSFCFDYLHCGLKSAVSPGSILTILFLSGKSSFFPVLTGIAVSIAVTFVGSVILLKLEQLQEERMPEEKLSKKQAAEEQISEEQIVEEKIPEKEVQVDNFTEKKVQHIGFVCDGGMGSSAMGAALFRRTLAQSGITGIKVAPYAADMVPEDVDLIVCQEDFYQLTEYLWDKNCYRVSSFVKTEEYQKLAEKIKKSIG